MARYYEEYEGDEFEFQYDEKLPVTSRHWFYIKMNQRNKETNMAKSKIKVNKFYLGAQSISTAILNGDNPSNTYEKIEDAVFEAKRRVESGQSKCEIVVQIIKIVRQRVAPVVVESVK